MSNEKKATDTMVNLNGLPLGYCLKLKRIGLGLLQKDVARILGISQVSTVSRIEQGKREVPKKYKERVMQFLVQGGADNDKVVE
ncbi:helix-turn-helix transcriptional regulator [Bacillus cereus group sp. TH217LC]|uniref:helix-turn-helix domain-containing protein n=1 Tax=Bacillus cereus group sp. TH217LC TaxID=3018051 RepID=UPI0022E35C9F|nr:helix-turn-helix transcriptional regulator [Bacillus cereus group sp. TH217LC]MDA1598692.1 helix-turn-helix transcriptional regulator [Bacillus cereus group sp. TH217LC]